MPRLLLRGVTTKLGTSTNPKTNRKREALVMAKSKKDKREFGERRSNLGRAGGAAAGAAVGTLLGPIGAAVGAVVGGVAGAEAVKTTPRSSKSKRKIAVGTSRKSMTAKSLAKKSGKQSVSKKKSVKRKK